MMKKKLASKAGESISETLVSVLIMMLAFMILAGAVVAAARVNHRIKNEDVAFTVPSQPDTGENATLTVSLYGGETRYATQNYDVKLHESNEYYYYDGATKNNS